jgi:hypothetical protein
VPAELFFDPVDPVEEPRLPDVPVPPALPWPVAVPLDTCSRESRCSCQEYRVFSASRAAEIALWHWVTASAVAPG